MPDFFLSSEDDVELARTRRACTIKRRIRRLVGEDALLVAIEPALPGGSYASPRRTIDEVIVAPKWEGGSVTTIRSWPVPVYVLSPTRKLDDLDFADKTTYSILAWGVLEPPSG